MQLGFRASRPCMNWEGKAGSCPPMQPQCRACRRHRRRPKSTLSRCLSPLFFAFGPTDHTRWSGQGVAEWCMLCFSRAPRFKVAAWRDGCCDGVAPLGSCPKHILEAVRACPMLWPPRRAERGADISAVARQWHEGHALRALRPPKRRGAARHAAATNRDCVGLGGGGYAGAAECMHVLAGKRAVPPQSSPVVPARQVPRQAGRQVSS